MDKPNKIWRTGSKNIAGYKKLGQNYREKNGSLLGFLEKYGVLITDEKKPYKLRVDGDRIKLANLQSYDAYQTLRQNLSGYKKVEKELLNLGISKEEVNAFIQDDKQKYKQIQSEVKAADKISSEAVEKGHIGSLKSGYPDVSSNIEPELKRINAAKQGKSPFSGALLAEGVPRTSQEAFIRWKDSSGLPNPSDYTYEQRQLLRQAKNVNEVDDLIMSFEKGGVRVNRNLSKFGKGVSKILPGSLDDAIIGGVLATGAAGATLLTGGSPAQAGEAFLETGVDVATSDLQGGNLADGTLQTNLDKVENTLYQEPVNIAAPTGVTTFDDVAQPLIKGLAGQPMGFKSVANGIIFGF